MPPANLGLDGITANAIVLGIFKSGMTLGARDLMLEILGEAATDAFFPTITSSVALGKMGEPEEVEELVGLLASDAGAFMTDAAIAIHGGLRTMMRAHPGLA